MDVNAVGRRRLVSHGLGGTPCATPEDAVRAMGALQAQAYGQALWAIGRRTYGATLADVERAIAERRILLTWPLRGTLHVIPAQDARWMLRVSAPRTLRAARGRMAQLALDDATVPLGRAEVRSLVSICGRRRRRLTGTAMPPQGSA